jgi:hypothetical protein
VEKDLITAESVVDRVTEWVAGPAGSDSAVLSEDLAGWRSNLTYRRFTGNEVPEPCSGCSTDY